MNNLKKYLELKKIIGIWQSKRLILNKIDKSKAIYNGKMSIAPEIKLSANHEQGNKNEFISLQIREDGDLTANGATYQFSQKYELRIFKDRCDVFLKDKSLFFSILRSARKQRINYLCKLDRYLGQIVFVDESSFLLCLKVSGPKKEYYLKVLYKRLKGCNTH